MTPLPELMSFLDGLNEPHIVFDQHYKILAANTAYRQQFSPEQNVVGRKCFEVSHHFSVPCDQAGETCPLARARASGQRERVMHLHHTPRGREYVNVELSPLKNVRGEQEYFVEKMATLPHAHGMPKAQGLIGISAKFQSMLELVARVAPSTASVLLLGESGTGKELLARAVHASSARAQRPLVVVDCASMPENLFESELFGHERGAFTGANTSHAGLVESASGGTLFLDEVGDIPLAIQIKLLRLLETGTYRRVGSAEQRYADIRVISATHRDIQSMVGKNQFREDLFYRISTFPIQLPALRERREDIGLLTSALLNRIEPKRKISLSAGASKLLQELDFPGNIRELRNLLERTTLLCDGDVIRTHHIRQAQELGIKQIHESAEAVHSNAQRKGVAHGETLATASYKDIQRQVLSSVVSEHRGSRKELAQKLGISERSLYRKLRAG